MEPAKRIIINTIAQYTKAIINICLSLYSTRLILHALNVSDYGIYSVVGGVVAMLGFLTNALVITTQRYISYYHGAGKTDYISKIFANSLFLHITIGVVIGSALLVCRQWIVFDVLNIETARLQAADTVYIITVAMLFITIITAPYKALFIARENIVYISVVEIFDGVLKLVIAICISYITIDRLITYAWAMAGVLSLNLIAYVAYAKLHFQESCIIIKPKQIDRQCIKQLVGFIGWTSYGMGAIACRNQGTGIILNHFFGTVINAAYGISFQVYGAISFIATSILNAMNPQILKAEGGNHREDMLRLAGLESKYSTAFMAMISIPIMIEMPAILSFWLKDVPDHTATFCRFIILAFLFDQITIGLNVANQALGKIKTYTIITFTPKLILLPFFYLILANGGTIAAIMWTYTIVELIVALIRIPYLAKTAGLSLSSFIKETIVPLIPLCITLTITGELCANVIDMPYRFVVTIALCVISGAVSGWYFSTSDKEKEFIKNLLNQRLTTRAKY